MKAEQFHYGLFPRYGIKLVKSPGLNTLLTTEIVDYLKQLKQDKELLWPSGIITVTKVYSTSDEFGRDGNRNHTIAVKLIDFLAYSQPTKILEPYFENRETPPAKLEPIEVK